MIKCNAAEAKRFQGEIRKCRKSVTYFLDAYGQIYDATAGGWVPFRLWPAQIDTLRAIVDNRLTIVLKARQLGLSWLVLSYALWLMLFHPAATVLLFSRRDEEAVDLLKVRLRGLYDRLPEWLKVQSFVTDNDHEWHWSNGSRALAFPTTGGDSYCATLVIIDEADLVPDFDRMMASVKPTIDGGGRMILVSRADKSRPSSSFKKMYFAAKQSKTGWKSVFLPWDARPDRSVSWYESQRAEILHRTGSLDTLQEQYPKTDAEALTARTLDKRIAPQWLQQCWQEQSPLAILPAEAPSISGLMVYSLPERGRSYVVGADPAQGNPTSDDSALIVLCRETGEEVASIAGKLEPATFAQYIGAIGRWYNNAGLMVERNNHGWAVLQWLRENSRLIRLYGHDCQEGWLSSSKGKALLYDAAAEALRNRETAVHTFGAFAQLSSIEGNTLHAPDGESDDLATAYGLACTAMKTRKPSYTIEGPLLCSPGPSLSRVYEDDGSKSYLQRLFDEIPGLREYYAGDDDPPYSIWDSAPQSSWR